MPSWVNAQDASSRKEDELAPLSPELTFLSTLMMIKYLQTKGQDIVQKPYYYSDLEDREPLMYYHRELQPK